MTDLAAPVVPTQQTINDLRRAADLQAQHQWARVHWLDHNTGRVGIYGALRMAIYAIASYTVDPTFVPSDDQRARVWRASQVLNEHVSAIYGVRYAFDWNTTVCQSTDDAVALFRNAADALERRTK